MTPLAHFMNSNLIFKLTLLFLAVILINSCKNSHLKTGEGYIDVDGGKVWYRVVGKGRKTPILVLHGGPGFPSYYLKSLEALGKDRKVIFYDQLGCGRSDRITDTSLMTLKHYVNELSQVIQHFELDEYYLYAHSRGTMIGVDYYLAHPPKIKALILSSPVLSTYKWIEDANELIQVLPKETRTAIRSNEFNMTYDAPEYQQAVQDYYKKFLLRINPWPAEMDSSLNQMGVNVYRHMWGPSEFTLRGTLRTYNRTSRLHEIYAPTLFIAGEYDEARPSTAQYYQKLVYGAKLEVIRDAAHLTTLDKPAESNQVIIDFLNEIEN